MSELFLAYQDDMHACDLNPYKLLDQAVCVERELAVIGLKLQRSKCKLLIHGSPAPQLLDYATKLGIEVISDNEHCIRVVGCYIGAEASIQRKLDEKLDETLRALELASMTSRVHPRIAINLLRYCVIPKLLFRFSTQDVSQTIRIATSFDEALLKTILGILQIQEATQSVLDLIYCKLGLGFPQYTQELPRIRAKTLENISDARIAADKANTACNESNAPRSGKTEEPDFRSEAVLRNNLSISARILGLNGPSASSWMGAIAPSHLSVQAYLSWMRIRLGLSTIPTGKKCFCGDPATPEHILICNRLLRTTSLHRHDQVKLAISNWATAYGVINTVEPGFYVYDDGSAKRPDITFYIDPVPLTTDLTIVEDMDKAAIEKIKKHDSAVSQASHTFVPFVMSIWGGLHSTSNTVVEKITARLPPSTRKIARMKFFKTVSDTFVEASLSLINNVIHSTT